MLNAKTFFEKYRIFPCIRDNFGQNFGKKFLQYITLQNSCEKDASYF